MAAESSRSSLATGGHANGKFSSQPNGRTRPSKRQRGFFAWAINAVARLATWATILTILFRCPSSIEQCDEASPFICKYYFGAKNVVSPHVQPYYDQYAGPYVDIARPYYDAVNTKVLIPSRHYAVQYGAPWAVRGRDYVWVQWESNGQPQVAKLRYLSQLQYDRLIAPYIDKVSELMGPYYNTAQEKALDTFHGVVLPSYEYVHPYAIQGYNVASGFAADTAMPAAYWTWNKANGFLNSAVWPHLRVIYIENVEPQLHRIGERLGRYNLKAKTKVTKNTPPVIISDSKDPIESSSVSKPPPQISTSDHAETATSETFATTETEEAHTEYRNPVEAPPPTENETERRRKAREMVAHDLDLWQNKFAAQAEEGAAEIEDVVDEIASHIMDTEAQGTGAGLIAKLESTIQTEFSTLKETISSLAGNNDQDADTAETAAVYAVRQAGVAIKKSAQVIRGWREEYDQRLKETVVGAADKHFQILDATRGLALQEIGMRWAWTDGISYKDWAKYHELKNTFTQWTEELKELVVTHPTLLEAQEASAQMEDDGMTVASAAARELARLKEVAHWKIVAQDGTDNFDSETMKAAAAAVEEARKLAEEIKDTAASVVDDSEEKDHTPDAHSTTEGREAEKSNDVEETESPVIYIADANQEVAQESEEHQQAEDELAQEPVEANALDEEEPSVIESVSSATSSAKDFASSISDVMVEKLSAVTEEAKSIMSESEDTADSMADEYSANSDEASSTASQSVESFASAMASILADVSGAMEQRVAEAETTAPAEAESTVSAAPDAASSSSTEAVDSLSSFAARASEVLFGDADSESVDDETEAVSDDGNVDQTDDAEYASTPSPEAMPEIKPAMFGAAAQQVPKQKPILDEPVDDVDFIGSATDAAQAAYSNAASLASERYASAVSVVSAQIYGTPQPVHEKLLASVSAAYDDALAAASAKLAAATDAAADALRPTTTQEPGGLDWEKVESIAAQRLGEGRLWAEMQYSSALIAAGLATPTPTSPTDKYYDQAKLHYYAGVGLAQERYSSFLASASSAWYSAGTAPTPTDMSGSASSIFSAASETAASVISAAGDGAEAVYSAGTESLLSVGQAVDDSVAAVVEAASDRIIDTGFLIAGSWDDVVSQLSSQVYGEPTPVGWLDSAASGASSAAAAATEAVSDGASSLAKGADDVSGEASKQYDAVSKLVSELLHGKEQGFSESVLSRLGDVYSTAASNVASAASEATEAASSVGERVGEAASQATEAVKESVERRHDEL